MKTKNILILIILCLLSLSLITACSKEASMTEEPLNFSGDLMLWASIQEIWTELELIEINNDESTINAYELDACITAFNPIVNGYDVYIRAEDGFMVRLDGDTISETYLAYIEDQGWSYISDKHPVNSGVKHITDIIVVTNSMSHKSEDKLLVGIDPDFYGLNIISGQSNLYYTKGELLLLNNKQVIMEDGVSTYNDISIDVLKQKQIVSMDILLDVEFKKLLVYTFSGEEFYDYNNEGSIEVTSDQINYITNDLKTQKLNIVGVMINPIGESVKNNYYDAQYYLDKDVKVISVLLDGFSYQQFEHIKQLNPDLFIASQDKVKIAKTVYKPVTNAGFAAIVSGVEPMVSGVLDRSYRELKVPTIFDFCELNNKSHVLVEGDINILNLNTTTHLNIDSDNNGFTDNEIMATVKELLKEDYDYTFIHFHSIDEFGHEYGPLAKETLSQITLIDGYLTEIINGFNGKVIITADHGMHKVEDYGDHGDFRYEDFFVPYMIINGGQNE